MRTIYGSDGPKRPAVHLPEPIIHKSKPSKWYSSAFLAAIWAKRPAKLLALLAFVAVAAILIAVFAASTERTNLSSVDFNASPKYNTSVSADGHVRLMSAPGTAFAPTSFWNTPLPNPSPLNANNTTYVNEIVYELKTYYPPNAALGTYSFSAPIYTVDSNTPLAKVNPFSCKGNPIYKGFSDLLANPIPVPANAKAAAGTDEEIVFYNPSSDTLWEFWKFEKTSTGGWQACWGGKITNVSQNEGIFPAPFGAMATGLPLLGAMVRIDELQRGQIKHAIGIALVRRRKTVFSWPANRTDGALDDPLAIPEGLRFRLDPSLDLTKYNLTPVARMIAVAAQKYGFVVDDGAGAVQIRMEDPTPLIDGGQPDPYKTLYGGLPLWQLMGNFPWDHLQALPFDYGKPL